jgi:OFA family oxalate/formate antiporter-like MFS transporter
MLSKADNQFNRANRAGVTIVCACLSIFMAGSLVFGFPGVLASYWQISLGASKAQLGRILFFVLVAVGSHMFVIGRMQEKIGIRFVMALGAILYGLGALLAGYADSMVDVYIWAFITGAASAFIYLPAMTVAQLWYPRRRGTMSGLVSMCFGISGAAMAPVFKWLLDGWGYKSMSQFVGLSYLVLGVAAALMIRLPLAERVGGGPAVAVNDGQLSIGLIASVKTRSFWLMWTIYALVGGAGIAMVPLAVAFGTSRHLAVSEALIILMAFNLTNGISRLISGYLSDRIGRKIIMGTAFLCAGLAYLLMPWLDRLGFWALMAAVVGFAFGTLFAVSAPYVSECFGMAHFGSVFGMVFTAFGFVAGILGPWFGGHLLDITDANFTIVFSYFGSLMLLAAALIRWWTPHTECRM